MFTKDPQVTGLGDCFVGRFGNFIGITQTVLDAGIEQFGQFILIKAQ
jgi:hypothetical protein